MTSRFDDLILRKEQEHGDKFDPSELLPKFGRYYSTGERIKVRASWGDEVEEITGTVGVTTGWRPAFLLMRRSNAIGSSTVLTDRYEVVAVKDGRRYRPVAS